MGDVTRQLTSGEQAALIAALMNEASRQQLSQINSDLIAGWEHQDAGSAERLRAAAERSGKRRELLEFFAALIGRNSLIICSPVIILEQA